MSKKVMKRLLCREIGSMVQSIMSISVISVAIIMIEMKQCSIKSFSFSKIKKIIGAG
jgi:hypothetical protein